MRSCPFLVRNTLLLSSLFLLAQTGPRAPALAQEAPARPQPPTLMAAYQELARSVVSGERARAMVDAMDPSYRVPGNRPFNAALNLVVEALEEAGYRAEGPGIDGPLTYRMESREMNRPTWEPVRGSLEIVGAGRPLMTLATNINLVAANSYSTPTGGVEAPLVDVGRGTTEDFGEKDVRGKIVMGDGSVRQLFRTAVQQRGALGVLAYRLSSFNRPEENRDIAPMSSIGSDEEAGSWGLLLTGSARDALKEALASGPVRVRVDVETRIYPSEEKTLVAEIRGRGVPEERLVFSAHVQESGANDNATGVAAQAEIARVLAGGVKSGAFSPRRTITMIWGDEISSTRRFLEEDSVRAQGVIWGLSLDMVGEDTEKTGGTFLIEKMPDPSAVWTRGEDRHTEWGGRPLTVDDLTPHYLNDFLLNRCLDQASETGWIVRTNPYEGGSDHVPFLRAGIPAVLLWHFTDQYYHTDGDRLEMVSAETLRNVGVCAAVSAMTLTAPTTEVELFVVEEVERSALDRIRREADLSREAVRGGADPAQERFILETWTQWYLNALDTIQDLEAAGPSPEAMERIREARQAVVDAGRRAIASFGR